ncbi:MAG: hypothetical protein ACSLFI_00055 [Solirubrobacterales bacterium]
MDVAADWSDLYVAAAGASAALAGLVFVAVSINLDDILQGDGLPDLALVTLLLLIAVLIVSLFGLIPGQDAESLGWKLLAFAITWGLLVGRFARRSVPEGFPLVNRASRLLMPLVAIGPYVIGSILLMSGEASGLDWVFVGIIGSIAVAMVDAWILLVEIRR